MKNVDLFIGAGVRTKVGRKVVDVVVVASVTFDYGDRREYRYQVRKAAGPMGRAITLRRAAALHPATWTGGTMPNHLRGTRFGAEPVDQG